MKKVKITVLETTLNQALAEEYGAEGLQACPMMKQGQVFYADYAKPQGFCDEAWKAIYQYVFALAHGKTCFITGSGSVSPGWPLFAATMGCVRCCLNWRPPRRKRPSTTRRWIAVGKSE